MSAKKTIKRAGKAPPIASEKTKAASAPPPLCASHANADTTRDDLEGEPVAPRIIAFCLLAVSLPTASV